MKFIQLIKENITYKNEPMIINSNIIKISSYTRFI